MPYDLGALFGKVVQERSLKLSKARAVAGYAHAEDVHYVHLRECRRRDDGAETVILDLKIEVAQRPINAIQEVEVVAITMSPSDSTIPDVVSLREDFPQVPHLNLRQLGEPKSLCLYGERYSELKLHWTAHRFVERIREWLAKTADGTLHPEDQPLEQLLATAHGTLLVPENLGLIGSHPRPYCAVAYSTEDSHPVWSLVPFDPARKSDERAKCVAFTFACPSQTHGVISWQPSSFEELDTLLRRIGFDLLGEIRKQMDAWKKEPLFDQFKNAQPFIVLTLPKTRRAGGPTEDHERVAYLCFTVLGELERQLEHYQLTQSYTGSVAIPEAVKQSANILLYAFEVTPQFSPGRAAFLNGIPEEARQFCLIGAGALGSQVFDNLMRAGFGRWSIVDPDNVLPHNLARHALGAEFVGHKKAKGLSLKANILMLPQQVATPFVVDLLKPANKAEVEKALTASSAVLDCSASVPVARALALCTSGAGRIISVFLNPAGNALVCLAEDERRACRLDWLEMRYYREVSRNDSLADHFQTTSKTRYSNACRSVTSRLSQENVGLFAAVGSRAFREAVKDTGAHISIWALDAAMQVARMDVPAEPVVVEARHVWTVCTDQQLLHNAASFRLLRLPYETGGVLIGTYDTERRIVYVVDMLPSPPDSEEWPTSYRRGSRGLARAIVDIQERTLQNLEYVGEWHSHPNGCGVGQSNTDKIAMAEITGEMSKAGLPGLMLIVGDSGQYTFHVAG